MRSARTLGIALGLIATLQSPAGAADSWSVTHWSEVGGKLLRWSREPGAQSSYLAVDSAADSTALLHSSDSGASWSRLGPAVPIDAAHLSGLQSLARSRTSWGDLLFTSTQGPAYRRAASDGAWRIFGPEGEGRITASASLPNGELLVARASGDPDARVYRSTDDGTTWSAFALPHLMDDVVALRAFDPGPIYTLDASGQVWRADSTDFSPAAPFLIRQLDVANSSVLHAIAADHSVRRSTNGGASWALLSSDLANFEEWSDELDRAFSFGVDGDFAWLAAPSALWTSNDGGHRWALALHSDSLYSAAAWNSDAREFLLGGREITLTRDAGALFLARSGLDFSRTTLFDDGAAVALSRGLLVSGDGGTTWERWSWDGAVDHLSSLRAFGRFGFVTRSAAAGPSLFVSTNRGRAWRERPDAPRDLHEVKRTDDGVWWAASDAGLYRGGDGASNFELIASPLEGVDRVGFYDARLGVAARALQLALTTDAGGSWTLFAAPEDSLTDLLWVNSDTLFAAGRALHRSADRGAHWEAIADTRVRGGRWRALTRADHFTVWAAGDRGSLAVARDAWTFHLDDGALEPRDPSVDLLTLGFAGADRGLSGAGPRLWRYGPDSRGPRFSLHGVFHPLLPHVLHLYFTCGERLQGDSLRVVIGGERFTLRAGADPFLYALTYGVPSEVGAVNLAATGADLAGNRATTSLAFSTMRGALRYRDGDFELRLAGAAEGSALVAFAVDAEELPPLPGEFVPLAQPLRCTEEGVGGAARRAWRLNGTAQLGAGSPRASDFAVLGRSGWSRWTDANLDDAESPLTLWPIERAQDRLRVEVTPNPVRSVLSLSLPAEARGIVTLRILDVSGRVRARHETSAKAGEVEWALPSLPNGRYWLEVRALSPSGRMATTAFTLLHEAG